MVACNERITSAICARHAVRIQFYKSNNPSRTLGKSKSYYSKANSCFKTNLSRLSEILFVCCLICVKKLSGNNHIL